MRLNNLPEVTKQVSGRSRIQPSICLHASTPAFQSTTQPSLTIVSIPDVRRRSAAPNKTGLL